MRRSEYVAGANEAIFDDSAFEAIYNLSGGIPRRINRICELSLLGAAGRGVRQIDGPIVKESLHDLGG